MGGAEREGDIEGETHTETNSKTQKHRERETDTERQRLIQELSLKTVTIGSEKSANVSKFTTA